MTTTHTPDTRERCAFICGGAGHLDRGARCFYLQGETHGDRHSCWCAHDVPTSKTNADARLIAAAPELLAAAEALSATSRDPACVHDFEAALTPDITRLEAAIAKARGE